MVNDPKSWRKRIPGTVLLLVLFAEFIATVFTFLTSGRRYWDLKDDEKMARINQLKKTKLLIFFFLQQEIIARNSKASSEKI